MFQSLLQHCGCGESAFQIKPGWKRELITWHSSGQRQEINKYSHREIACNVLYHCILYLIGANLIYGEGGREGWGLEGGGGWHQAAGKQQRSVRQKVKPSACHTAAL